MVTPWLGAAMLVLSAAGLMLGQVEPVEAQPSEPATVSGQAVDAATGAPLAKTQVEVIPMGRGRGQRYSGITNTAGHFTISNIAPGDYWLSAQKNRYSRATYGQRRPGDPGETLTLGSGERLEGLALKLAPAAVVTGRVLDEEGEPVPYVQVSALRYRYIRGQRELVPAAASAMTNDLGEYRMFGVPPGKYYFSATSGRGGPSQFGGIDESAGEMARPTLYWPGVVEAGQAAPLNLRAGQEQSGVDFQLRSVPAVRIAGRVEMGPGGTLPGNVSVMLRPRQTAAVNMTVRSFQGVDSKTGKFELRGALPGSYTLVATTRSREQLFAQLPIEVGNDSIEGLVLQLSPGLKLSGRLEVEGEPPSDFDQTRMQVRLQSSEALFRNGAGQVNEEGNFTLEALAPTMYHIRVFGLPEGAYLKAATVDEQEVLDAGLDLAYGSVAELKLVVSLNGGGVSGTVKNDDDEPMEGAKVVLIPSLEKRARQELYMTASTDEYGKFNISGVTPGEYMILAFEYVEGGAHLDPSFPERYEDEGEVVTIEEKSQEVVELEAIPENTEG